MRRIWTTMTGILMVGLMVPGCETIKEICDFDCGKYTEGEVSISGNPQIDGFFKALNNVELAVAAIQGQFAADVLAIAEAFGVAEGLVDSAYVAKVKAAVDAEYQAKLVGGKPQVIYQKPRCEASLDVAVKASAECKVKGGCQVDIECKGGELTMTCEGVCRGSCSGQCTVPVCEIELDVGGQCSAECHGTCEVQVDASCEGICRGSCSGDCSAYDVMGNCMGYCEGNCVGTCEASVTGGCSGVCRGKCYVTGSASATCQGKLGCEGSCEGECTGSCEGKIEAPRCSTDAACDVEARCDAQASIQASADLHCRPPRMEIRYVFKASVDEKAKAEFFARLAVLEERMASIAQGHAKFFIFLDGDPDLGIEPVLPLMLTEFKKLADAVTSGEIEINIVRLACVAPAIQEAVGILTALPGQLGGTFSGQLTMMGVIGQ